VRHERRQPAAGGEGGARCLAGADLVICADNDRKTEGNPGLTAATAAAKATGARLAVPEFPEGVSGSDFNDLANLRRAAR
jgi:putative DNA primase/helicase